MTHDQIVASLVDSFVERHGAYWRYCSDWRRWFEWDGTRWKRDRTDLVLHLVRIVARDANPRAEQWLGKFTTIARIERAARTDPRITTVAADWNDHYLSENLQLTR